MKKTDFSVSLRDGARLKQYTRLLSQSLSASLLLLTLMWYTPALGQGGNCSLGCHGAQVSLGMDCTAEVTVAMVGETNQCPNGQFTVFVIKLNGDTVPTSPIVTEDEIGLTLIASVYDNITGNSCWSYITVQDKMKPRMDCDCTPVTTFTGAITGSDPTTDISEPCWTFGCCEPIAGTHYYDEWRFKVAEAGMYVFTLTGSLNDPIAAIFDQSFNPVLVCDNLLGGDDDSGGFAGPPIITIALNMVPGNYVLVTTTYNTNVTGTYRWTVSGPGDVFNGDEDCFVSCSAIDQSHPIPVVVDNCTPQEDIIPILLNEEVKVLCHPQFVKKLTRKWTAKDASGNRADTCIQVFYLKRINFGDIVWPLQYTVPNGNPFLCDAGFTDVNQDGIPDAVPVAQGGAGVPTINGVAIYPDFMFYCNSSVQFQDVPIYNPGSCVKKVMRVWTANEWHCTGERDTLYSQLIEVIDNKGPVITCPLGFSHTTTGHFCTAAIWIPKATVTDNCSAINSVTVSYPGGFKNQNGLFYADLPVGENVITYTAYDQCYNSSQCTMIIVVEDKTPPIPVCIEHTVVSLTLGGPQGLTKVDASVFDNGSYDACGPVTFKARRMTSCLEFDWTTGGAGIDETPDGEINSRDRGTVHRTKVPFACCDAGAGPIMIELEVTDVSGNVNYCMVEVVVQDKIKPLIKCPSDITISCDYPLNINDLSAFGNVVRDQHDVQEWCIYDPTNPDADHDGFVCGIDGLATDNCNVEIRVTNTPVINNCGVGYIRRSWTASDANGTATCIQYIYIRNFSPISGQTIDWPDDYLGLECAEGTDPDDLSYPYDRPRYDEDECDLVGVTYEDVVFPFVTGACFKILRTWKIIEWCLYEEYGGIVPGKNYWEHVQVIKVIDQFAPNFLTDQPLIDRCNNFDCNGIYLELTQRADDVCTPNEQLQWSYAVDFGNNQTIDWGPFSGLGAVINASGTYPLGYHRVIYTFEDRCGNRTVREQFLDLKSCKAPVPVCINGLSAPLMAVDTDGDGIEDTGMITIWASDFDASSYHPCGSPFVLSLAPDINVTSLTFDCSHVGMGQIPVNLYATDHLGNQAYCPTYIIITDNAGLCPQGGGLTGTITGNVSTETSDNVLNVEVKIAGSTMLPINTNSTGMYTFPAMPVGGNYVVSPEKNNDFKNGVSTLDLVHIQKHLLGIQDLDSPYKMVAADANNSSSITAVDLIELRKLILGIYSELPNNTSWRFVDKTYTFPDPHNPWMQPWPESHNLNTLIIGMNHADFFGIKIGDVNNTVKANATSILPRGAGQVFDIVMDDRNVSAGETFEIPVFAAEATTIEGIQFSLELGAGLQLVDVKAGSMDVTGENFGWLQNRILTSSWNKAAGLDVNTSKALFTLVLRAGSKTQLSQAISLTSNPTEAEVYTAANDIMDLALTFRGVTDQFDFELLQNEPNPFTSMTQIGYVIPERGQVTLTLFDLTGKQLFNQTVNGEKGLNKIEIRKDQISSQGMIYYQVQFQGYTATKKMLIL